MCGVERYSFFHEAVHLAGHALGDQDDVASVALMSCVPFRKIDETRLDWLVEMDDIAEDVYPF